MNKLITLRELEKNPFYPWDDVSTEVLEEWLRYNRDWVQEHNSYNMGPNMMRELAEYIENRKNQREERE